MKTPAGLSQLAKTLHVPPAALAVGGVGGVAGLALVARSRNKGNGDVPTATADTTASDLYNALQPQIEQVLEAVRAANAAAALGGSSLIPGGGGLSSAPAPTQTSAPSPSFATQPSSGALVQTGSLNDQPVFTTPQGYPGQFIPQVPGVSYAGFYDLVDPRTGLASITGISGDQVARYAALGYTPVSSGRAPVPVGENVYGNQVQQSGNGYTAVGPTGQAAAQAAAMAANPGVTESNFIYDNIFVPS